MDWNLVLKQHLQNLIQINTTNPPGNELAAARYLQQVLDQANISNQVFEPSPGRGSIVARLPGDGSKAPLLLLAHLDVVPANADEWTHPPFTGVEVEGRIWGRGAMDIKNLVATWMTLLQRLAAEGFTPKRDIILAATADEEAGGRSGLGWLVQHRPELVDCEYCLNEGGGNAMALGGKTYVTLQSGEKASTDISVIARGTAGHASVPLPDNAVAKLARALSRIAAAELPVHLTKTVAAFLAAVAGDLGFPGSVSPEQALSLLPRFVSNPFERAGLAAMLRNTACPTLLQAGQKLNVAPSQAVAHLDGRVLPGQTGAQLVQELLPFAGDEVEISAGQHLPATESDPDSELAALIRQIVPAHLAGASVIPFLSPGATDARYLRPRGVTVYGFGPMLPGERVELAHGVDERISLDSLYFGLRVLDDVVRRFTR